jgi:branched-chain amino acid transport system substrate-binding protein
LGDLVLGAKFVASYSPGAANEANKKFVAAYRRAYNEEPDVNASMGYDNGKAIMLTLEKLGGKMPADGAEFISILRSLSYDAPRGRIRFNAQNSALLEKEYMVEIVRGPDGKPQRKDVDVFPGAEDLPGCTKTF